MRFRSFLGFVWIQKYFRITYLPEIRCCRVTLVFQDDDSESGGSDYDEAGHRRRRRGEMAGEEYGRRFFTDTPIVGCWGSLDLWM